MNIFTDFLDAMTEELAAEAAPSRVSDHTHVYKDGSRKIDIERIPGVNAVGSPGHTKLAVTPAGGPRLKREIDATRRS
jgi:hypothetical protein